MTRRTVLAAGGLVFRNSGKMELAVVRLKKYPHWVLPKGKLKAKEKCRGAAKREVFEETGHRVFVHEFVGTLAYESSGRSKIVQFWRMEVRGEAIRDPASDVREVRWLSPKKAIERLTHYREQTFLRHALAQGILLAHKRNGHARPRRAAARH